MNSQGPTCLFLPSPWIKDLAKTLDSHVPVLALPDPSPLGPLHSGPLYSLWSQQPCSFKVPRKKTRTCVNSPRAQQERHGKSRWAGGRKASSREFQGFIGTDPILGQTAEEAEWRLGQNHTHVLEEPGGTLLRASGLHPELHP